MRLQEIHKIIVNNTNVSKWRVTQDAFLFPDFDLSSDTDSLDVAAHRHLAVYTEDVSLTFTWGARSYEIVRQNESKSYSHKGQEDPHWWGNKAVQAKYPYLEKAANRNTREITVSMLWNGSVIEEYPMLIVDGGRLYFPLPTLVEGSNSWSVGAVETGVARALNGEQMTHQFDHFLEALRLTVDEYDERRMA